MEKGKNSKKLDGTVPSNTFCGDLSKVRKLKWLNIYHYYIFYVYN